MLLWLLAAAAAGRIGAAPAPEPSSSPLVLSLIAKGDTWRYLDDGSDQGTAWREPAFDASAWPSGPAELGYGDRDEATTIGFGPDPRQKHITAYFRRSFDVPAPARFKSLLLRLRRDDGAIVYLNGREIVRSNMPAGIVSATTLAAKQVGGEEETRYAEHDVPPTLLVPGGNVVAAELHQGNPTSSDASFDLELVASDAADVREALLSQYRRSVTADRAFARENLPERAAAPEDWPTFMRDRARRGVTPAGLEFPLRTSWVHVPDRPPRPAWHPPATRPREGRILLNRVAFDDAFQVAVWDGNVLFGSSSVDCVVSLDAATGRRRWLFSTGGPVRLAPTVWQSKVYVGCDDGWVYCLDAGTGRVKWKHRAGPADERLLGNGRMVSRWPVRTSVLVDDGIAYFGAGVFPHEGVLLRALGAEDGRVVWRNDTLGQTDANRCQVTPQGYLLASDELLFVPSGRAMPAAFSKADGRLVYQRELSWRGVDGCGPTGGVYALLDDGQVYTGTHQLLAVDQRRGRTGFGWFGGRRMVISGDMAFMADGREIVAMRRGDYAEMTRRTPEFQQRFRDFEYQYAISRQERSDRNRMIADNDRQIGQLDADMAALQQAGKGESEACRSLATRRALLVRRAEDLRDRAGELAGIVADWKRKLDALGREKRRHRALGEKRTLLWRRRSACVDSMVLAGTTLVAGGEGEVVAFDAVAGEEIWRANVDGRARGLAVAEGRLFVSTTTGRIHCFGSTGIGRADASARPPDEGQDSPHRDASGRVMYERAAERILALTGCRKGWGLVLGGEEGGLAYELAVRSELSLVVVESDPDKASTSRRLLRRARLYGAHVVVDVVDPSRPLPYPNYFADLVVSDTLARTGVLPAGLRDAGRHVKPCGGRVCLGGSLSRGATVEELAGWARTLIPGEPKLVQEEDEVWCVAERGSLPGSGRWTHQYADAGNSGASADTLVRGPLGVLWYGAPGPAPMVDRHASAVAPLALDGRMFVQGENVVLAYDAYNGTNLWERRILGAMRAGMKGGASSNFAAGRAGVFVGVRGECHRLDPATGTTLATYRVPRDGKAWGYAAVADGVLFGSDRTGRGEATTVFAIEVKTGEVLWVHSGKHLVAPTLVIGDGRVCFVDSSISGVEREAALAGPRKQLQRLAGQAKKEAEKTLKGADVRLAVCLDARTGQVIWRRGVDVTECSGRRDGAGALSSIYCDGLLLLCGANANGHFWQQFLAGEFDRRRIVALRGHDGAVAWARDVPYRTRPLVVDGRVIADPYALDLRTGSFLTRRHPVTGREDRWQFLRGGHHCGAAAGSRSMLFFRAGSTAYYDLACDSGLRHFAGHRPGCWINTVPAGGLALIPEASAGCICLYSLRCTVALEPRPDREPAWAVCTAAGPTLPVEHLAVNLGAPGDRRDGDGTLWLAHPRPRPAWHTREREVSLGILPDGSHGEKYVFAQDGSVASGFGDRGWLLASGYRGAGPLTIPVTRGEGATEGEYAVRLFIAYWPGHAKTSTPVDLRIQGRTVAEGVEPPTPARNWTVREFSGIRATAAITVQIVPATPAETAGESVVLSGIEVLSGRPAEP